MLDLRVVLLRPGLYTVLVVFQLALMVFLLSGITKAAAITQASEIRGTSLSISGNITVNGNLGVVML